RRCIDGWVELVAVGAERLFIERYHAYSVFRPDNRRVVTRKYSDGIDHAALNERHVFGDMPRRVGGGVSVVAPGPYAERARGEAPDFHLTVLDRPHRAILPGIAESALDCFGPGLQSREQNASEQRQREDEPALIGKR